MVFLNSWWVPSEVRARIGDTGKRGLNSFSIGFL